MKKRKKETTKTEVFQGKYFVEAENKTKATQKAQKVNAKLPDDFVIQRPAKQVSHSPRITPRMPKLR
jgi:hypothetical protein